MTNIIEIQKEVSMQLANKEVMTALITTTFKGLTPEKVKEAIVEGMIRGFEFKDFLEKNIYAIPFSSGYSLVTSVDYARKIGMKNNVVGVSKPEYVTNDEGKIVSCSITVKRKIGEEIGEFTAEVFFDEYYKAGRNGHPSLWDTKPRTMISKVAEMHAYRKACPEDLSQMYVEEELQKEAIKAEAIDMNVYSQKLEKAKDIEELKSAWASLPGQAKVELKAEKEELKAKFENHANN